MRHGQNGEEQAMPALVPVNYPGNDTNGTIPVRLRLPASEVTGNPNYLEV